MSGAERNDGANLARRTMRSASVSAAALAFALCAAIDVSSAQARLEAIGPAQRFAPDIASTAHAEIRLTLSPDGRIALWFSRDRPGGAGGYDLWIARRGDAGWNEATPVPFNSPGRDFDPAFSADGRWLYFCSDRAGGLGRDDLYRIAFDGMRFGEVEHLAEASSTAAEFAPMPNADGTRLLFSSDRAGGAGGHDLYLAHVDANGRFVDPQAVRGAINTPAHEFDATWLADEHHLVFARVADFGDGRVDQFLAHERDGRYDAGTRLDPPFNDADGDSYGAMRDWSVRDVLLYSARRADSQGLDLYRVRHRRIQDVASE